MGKGVGFLKGFHFSHNCTEYMGIFREGDLVEINVNNQVIGSRGILGDWRKYWIGYRNNPVNGYIRYCKKNHFYSIELEHPVSLTRITNEKEVVIEFDYYSKYAKDIRLIRRADYKNRYELMDFEDES